MTEDREQMAEDGERMAEKSSGIRYWLMVIGLRGMRKLEW
jgi:hypothetical protein